MILHGQQIGTIKLLEKAVQHWSEREQNLIEKIADQVALALENSRLVEEAQKALRDQDDRKRFLASARNFGYRISRANGGD
ncbi:MAG: hypothetical protein IPN58_16070 [Anaerolineales bacterium]|nr:hypothetical protein [Anaerolineales bacterium]